MTSVISAVLVFSLCSWTAGDPLEQWAEFSRSKDKEILMKWLRSNALSIYRKEKNIESLTAELPQVYGRSGLFITLIKKGRVRGCFGAFDHSDTDAAILLRAYLKGALSYDPRYKPLELHELDETEIIITVTAFPEQVDDLNKVDISRFGVFIECDGAPGTVIVPAEFRTLNRLENKTAYSDCRVSRFRAVTIREEQK